jgi:uncharacterized membrane protein
MHGAQGRAQGRHIAFIVVVVVHREGLIALQLFVDVVGSFSGLSLRWLSVSGNIVPLSVQTNLPFCLIVLLSVQFHGRSSAVDRPLRVSLLVLYNFQ